MLKHSSEVRANVMHELVDDENVRVRLIEQDSNTVTLCFTGIGHALGGVDVQSEEFLSASRTSTCLFIIDKRRSWGNNIDFIGLEKVIDPYIRLKTINAIGNSMGGFLAILATRFFPINAVVAICPQFSVSKRVIPAEARFDRYVNAIEHWRYESLAGCFNQHTSYYILAGIGGDDDKQLRLFPSSDNIQMLYFNHPSFVHNVAQRLKEENLLYGVISNCFQRRTVEDIARTTLSKLEHVCITSLVL